MEPARRATRSLLASIGAIAFVVIPAIALAAPGDPASSPTKVAPEVQRHFELGNDLYREGKYDDALVEYDEAYALSHNWKILYNRGQCLVMIRREPEAIDSFRRYLHDGGEQISRERRQQVDADIVRLKQRLGTIVLTGAPIGARVDLDGHVVGTTPLAAPLSAGAGNHEIALYPAGGGVPFVRQVRVVAGAEVEQRIELGALGAPGAPGAPPPTSQPPSPPPSDVESPVIVPPVPPAGGLVAPSIMLAVLVGGVVPSRDGGSDDRRVLGSGELSATWRINPFWEVGGFLGAATGRHDLDLEATRSSMSDTAYAYGLLGIRGRMHLVRGKSFDGWFGIDIGGWKETWKVTGAKTFEYSDSAALLGLSVGVDVPLSRAWAIGGAVRYLAGSASGGACSGPDCASSSVSGSDARGFLELGLRVVFSIPLGGGAQSRGTQASAPPRRERAL